MKTLLHRPPDAEPYDWALEHPELLDRQPQHVHVREAATPRPKAAK